MRTGLFLLFLEAAVICCSGGSGGEPAKISVNRGAAPVIDGVFGEGEWSDARLIVPDSAKTIFLKHDGTNLYVAMNGDISNIYVAKENKLYVLHASYSLGWVEYTRVDGDTWTRDRDYEWQLYRLQEKTEEEIERGISGYMNQNGWTASLAPLGNKMQSEFTISFDWLNKPGGTPKFLITSFQNIPRSESKGRDRGMKWPAAAPVDSINRGYAPEKITLDVKDWGLLDFAR